jgi:hypothetical protein
MLHLTEKTKVVIIGPPGSGKSHVATVLGESSELPIYRTDKFLSDGHVQALYSVIDAAGDEGYIIEGMVGYRLLRKLKQLKLPPPDIVIQLEADDFMIEESYAKRNKVCNIKRLRAFCKAHDTVLEDYYQLDGEEPKIWINAQAHHLTELLIGKNWGNET